MKKLFFALSILISFASFGQDWQNNNWIFNNSNPYGGLNFTNTNPVQFNVTGLSNPDYNSSIYLEGCASVSDQNGNLLMFSNGINVWCRNSANNFITVTGELKGDPSSVQNVIFIPRPGYPNRYYIVTISGNTNYLNNGTGLKGLFYREIDTSTQEFNGPSTALSFLDPVLNSPVTVDEQFGNISESITSTRHSDGTDFWLLAHVQNANGGRLLSFKVTCSGFTNALYGPSNVLTIQNGKATAIKASPNSQRFALFAEDSVSYGSFNNTNGTFGPLNVISKVASYNGEFSPDSNILFYSNSQTLMARNLASSQDVLVANTSGFYGIQLARDNKIYFTGPFKTDTNIIKVIGSPNQFNNFDVTNTAINHPQIGFPQTVHMGNANIVLTSAGGTNNQTRCINTPIIPITYATTGATGATFSGLPAGVTGNWSANVVTISGTPTASGTFIYTVTLTGGCGTVTASGTITVNVNTISLTSGSDNQTRCINTPITNITYATTGATGATFSGLPAGVTGNWSANVVTISGTPTVLGVFNYTVTLTGGCGTITATGTIRVNTNNTINLTSAVGTNNQTRCINTPLANITYATTGATGATFSGLPAGVTGNWSANVVTISGTPTALGTFNYTVTLNGGCGPLTSATGTITVNPKVTPVFNNIPTSICAGITPTLPTTSLNGITGTWSGTNPYTFTPNSGQCANSVTVAIPVVGGQYFLNISDYYVDGPGSSNNSVRLGVNGNYPSGTTYFWTITREDGLIQTYTSNTLIFYVEASFNNRIVAATIIATYQGCSREYFDSFRCGIPNNDENDIIFPDCLNSGKISRIKNNIITVYPNPTKSLINFDGKDLSKYYIRVYDMIGKEMVISKIDNALYIDNLPQGLYIYEISEKGTVIQRGKIIKE